MCKGGFVKFLSRPVQTRIFHRFLSGRTWSPILRLVHHLLCWPVSVRGRTKGIVSTPGNQIFHPKTIPLNILQIGPPHLKRRVTSTMTTSTKNFNLMLNRQRKNRSQSQSRNQNPQRSVRVS